MPPNKSKTPTIAALNEVGRYAIGVRWADGHDSIYPLESLRRGCPCKACGGAIAGEIPPASQRLAQLSRLGERGVFLGWVLSLGVTLILAATLVVLPAMFELVGRRIEGERLAPPTAPAPERAAEEEPATPPKAASGGLRR